MDQILTVLLTTEMFVGGCLAFILDNTVPGMGQHWEGHTGLGWAHPHSNRWPAPQPEVWPGPMQCRPCKEKQGHLGWWSAHWLEGETPGWREARTCPTSFEEGRSRGAIPRPCELFPLHFLIAIRWKGAFGSLCLLPLGQIQMKHQFGWQNPLQLLPAACHA